MTKAEIIEKVAEQTGISRDQVNTTIESLFEVIQTNMIAGDSVIFRGFGTFMLKKRAKKLARNIQTKETIIVEAHYVPDFKPSQVFLDAVRNSETNQARILVEVAKDKTKKQAKQIGQNPDML